MATVKEEKQKTIDAINRIADKFDLNVSIQEDERYVEFEYWSDLGEDCIIPLQLEDFTLNDLFHELFNEADCFDAEDHASMWYEQRGQHGAPTSLRALLEDADKQQKLLDDIVDEVRNIVRENNRHE